MTLANPARLENLCVSLTGERQSQLVLRRLEVWVDAGIQPGPCLLQQQTLADGVEHPRVQRGLRRGPARRPCRPQRAAGSVRLSMGTRTGIGRDGYLEPVRDSRLARRSTTSALETSDQLTHL